MQVKAGVPIRLKITPLNEDGTPQGPALVNCQVIPLGPDASEVFQATRYQFEISNSTRPDQKAAVENCISVTH